MLRRIEKVVKSSLFHGSASVQRGVHSSSWRFPAPLPPPDDAEVASAGLPLLRQVVEHSDRPFLNELPDTDHAHDVDFLIHRPTLSYNDVIAKAIQISTYIQQHTTSNSSPFVAHSNFPGSDYIACQWGSFAAGRASVPLATSQKAAELEHVLSDANPSIILVCDMVPNYQHVLEAASNLKMTDRIVHVNSDILDGAISKPLDAKLLLETAAPRPSLDKPAFLMYTSGTTGKPKGVLHTHRSLYHQVTDLVAAWEWQKGDVALHVLPLHHVHGVVNVLTCAAYVGAQLQFQQFDAETLWRVWAQPPPERKGTPTRIPRQTVLMAVPTIYARLLETAKKLPPEVIERAVHNTLHPMRLHISGSAALPSNVLDDWKMLTHHTLLERYGMTEFAMALSNPYNEIAAPRQAGHVGVPLPSVSVRIVDETTGEVIMTPNQAGALEVKGPTVFSEYLNRPDATKEAFTDDGYFKTGDVAEFNDDLESYRILGRASVDILKVGGNKISALEIERTLLEYPNILEVAIVGIEDPIWGQRVGMIGRTDAPEHPTLEEIQQWCEPYLSKYKIPTRLVWMDEIPKNAMGKINKKELVRCFDEVSP